MTTSLPGHGSLNHKGYKALCFNGLRKQEFVETSRCNLANLLLIHSLKQRSEQERYNALPSQNLKLSPRRALDERTEENPLRAGDERSEAGSKWV